MGVLKKYQDPKGGLNAAGRAHFKRTSGDNLKPPAPNPKTKADVYGMTALGGGPAYPRQGMMSKAMGVTNKKAGSK
jgi:hypothetical protein